MRTKEYAEKIVGRLKEAGYIAYFAGGWVRDFLMGHSSSDIDIATDAPPEEIVKLFPRTIPVGISFGVVIVVMEGHQFEVSTFRRDLGYEDGRRPVGIALSTAEEDAQRRDFTINGMFYDPIAGEVLDFVHGQEDLKRGVIRTIGDPQERFAEDRLRMIRAVRFSVRFGFPMEPNIQVAIREQASTLFPPVSMERIWQELKKMAEGPHFDKAVLEMFQLGLLGVIFPSLGSLDVDELVRRIAPYGSFPKGCPPILYVMELFSEATADSQAELCQYLKVSNKNRRLVELAARAYNTEDWEAADWARYYAQPQADLCLEVAAARLSVEARREALQSHSERKKQLAPYIARIVENRSVVTAGDLQEAGILPGKKMGELLRQAERLSVNGGIEKKDELLAKLQTSPLWSQ